MKAFVFQPSNEFIGKFTVQNVESIPDEVRRFVASHDSVPLYSYVEASGQKWTIVNLDPLQLRTGSWKQQGEESVQAAESTTTESDAAPTKPRGITQKTLLTVFIIAGILSYKFFTRGPAGCYIATGPFSSGETICFTKAAVHMGSLTGKWHMNDFRELTIQWDSGRKQVLEWQGDRIEVVSSDGERHFHRPAYSRTGL